MKLFKFKSNISIKQCRNAFPVLNTYNRRTAILWKQHQQHTSMYTKITVVFIKCLNARNIGSVFNHLNTTHNLIAMQSKSVTSTKHYWGSTTQAQGTYTYTVKVAHYYSIQFYSQRNYHTDSKANCVFSPRLDLQSSFRPTARLCSNKHSKVRLSNSQNLIKSLLGIKKKLKAWVSRDLLISLLLDGFRNLEIWLLPVTVHTHTHTPI